jgi:hypothetical protein
VSTDGEPNSLPRSNRLATPLQSVSQATGGPSPSSCWFASTHGSCAHHRAAVCRAHEPQHATCAPVACCCAAAAEVLSSQVLCIIRQQVVGVLLQARARTHTHTHTQHATHTPCRHAGQVWSVGVEGCVWDPQLVPSWAARHNCRHTQARPSHSSPHTAATHTGANSRLPPPPPRPCRLLLCRR